MSNASLSHVVDYATECSLAARAAVHLNVIHRSGEEHQYDEAFARLLVELLVRY
jgi:hypothetical protein